MKIDCDMTASWDVMNASGEFFRLPYELPIQTVRRNSAISPAERMLWLEREDTRLSKTLHRLTLLRARYQEEARQLRCSFTVEDRKKYEGLKTVKPAETQIRDSESWTASL